MQNAKALVEQFLGSSGSDGQGAQSQSGFSLDSLLTGYGGLATGAAAGGLAGLLLGSSKPKKIAETALKVGGVALVGGLAYKAYQNWQVRKQNETAQATPAAEAPNPDAFVPETKAERENLARTLARAMIAAAKADGTITAQERARIDNQLQAIPLQEGDKQFIDRELAAPLSIDDVVNSAKSPEQATEIYTASLFAIDETGFAERGYLAMLAARLKLEQGLVEQIHASVKGEMNQAAA